MKERPILFNGEMVCAILDGRKTQTRRVVKTRLENATRVGPRAHQAHVASPEALGHCPYGRPGDLLWVRETWVRTSSVNNVVFKADFKDMHGGYWSSIAADPSDVTWRPSIHMPRWASRITPRITDVRVERVQDISVEECIAEGLSTTLREHDACVHLREQFHSLWDSINAKRGYGWDVNPWVWVVEFERTAS